MVRFVPFSKLVEMELNLSPADLSVPSYEKELDVELEIAATTMTVDTPQKRFQPMVGYQEIGGADVRIVGPAAEAATNAFAGYFEKGPLQQKAFGQ